MQQRGFSLILAILITALLLGCGIFLYKNSNLSFSITKLTDKGKTDSIPELSVAEQEIKSIPSDKFFGISCATLGFSGGTDSQGYYKEGGNYVVYGESKQIPLSLEETDKVNKALLAVIPDHPPKYNPDMQMCLSDVDNILITEGGSKSDPPNLFVLRLNKNYELKNKTTLKVENQVQGRPTVLGYTKDGILYLKAKGRNTDIYRSAESIFKIDFDSNRYEVLGRSVIKLDYETGSNSASSSVSETPKTDTIDYSTMVDTVKYNPLYMNTIGAKKFKKGELLFLNGSFTQEINSIPDEKLIGGVCIPYAYNPTSRMFQSLDRQHPRYEGYAGQDISSSNSGKVLLSLLKLRGNVTNGANEIGRILLCDLDNQDKIIISEPSKLQTNRDTYTGLLNNNYELDGKVQLKVPPDGGSDDGFPIAYTKDKIFYLKLQGTLFGGFYNLFKINFADNSYSTLYQGK